VEPHEHHLLLIVRMMRVHGPLDVDREQVAILVGDNYVLTFQERYGDVLDPVRARIRQGGPIFRSSGPEYLAYAILDAIVDGYYPVLEDFGERLDEIEQRITEQPEPAALKQVHRAKRELLAMRRAIWPLREVINSMLRGDLPFISGRLDLQLRDCYDHCVQALDVIETYRELAAGLTDAYLSILANRQNEVMKTLTIMASIFIPLSFLAGVYGMNFEYMPGLDYVWAYPALLLIMAGIAGGMLLLFRHRGWLGSGRKRATFRDTPSGGE
jgi:magnesium transporter